MIWVGLTLRTSFSGEAFQVTWVEGEEGGQRPLLPQSCLQALGRKQST
jgi:hypothetical protein